MSMLDQSTGRRLAANLTPGGQAQPVQRNCPTCAHEAKDETEAPCEHCINSWAAGKTFTGWTPKDPAPAAPAAVPYPFAGPFTDGWDALEEVRRAVAEITGQDVDAWPSHGNAALAIAATLANARRQLREAQAKPAFDLVAHLRRQKGFSELTFGPGRRVDGVTDHIANELDEVRESGGSLAEWVDVILLALDGAWRSGATPEQIAEAIAAKQARNEQRTWPDWRTAPAGKAIEHVRSADEPA